ncbi:phage tail tape measure protein [Sporosarcina highlanderae]|uniref:Phage tail tape measure protein n=1 Tax=Sporosarcina highlanderae TaxID=3035916 RepID=A0ABT8JUW5_9BACL|nr:phage tail tape measure protein [Sporosarcina highlanderae]MDN4608647.1 phage tail tape measure protein [Sporosarcina highlanderae]
MAMDLVARISLQDNLSARMKKVTRSMGDVEKRTRSTTSAFSKMGGVLAGLGVGVSFTRLTKSIVGIGAEFDTQMSKVQAISGATADEFKRLRDTARQLGKDTKFTMTEAGSAMEYLALAGWKTDAIISAMPGMLNLAAAGALDLGRAADITSDTMQAFGIAAENAAHVADVFAYAQANANTNVEQLGDAMTYLAPVANALGWELEASAAGIMAVSDAGIKGGMAGQAFATSLARLAKPTKAMNKEMKRLGINLFTADGKLKTLPDVIGELEKSTNGMNNAQKSAVLTTMFGAQAYKHWAVLLERGSTDLSRMTDELKMADGAAQRMADTMMDNLGGDWELFKSGMAEAAYSVYEKFAPMLRGIVQSGIEVAAKLPAATDALIAFSKPFLPLIKAVSTALAIIGGFMAVVGVFKLIGVAIAFLSPPMWAAIGVITALTLGFQALYDNSAPFRSFIDGVIGGVKGLFKVLSGDNSGGLTEMLEAGLDTGIIRKIFAIADGVKGGIDYLKNVFKAFGTGDVSNIATALGFSPETTGKIVSFVEGIKTRAGEFVAYLSQKWTELQPGLATLFEAFTIAKDTVISVLSSLWDYVQPVLGAWGNALKIVGDIVVMVFNNVIAPVIKFVLKTFQALWKLLGPILEFIGAAFGLAFGVLRVVWDTILRPVVGFLLGEFKNAFEKATPAIEAIGDVFGWIGDKISGAADFLRGFADKIKNFKVPDWLSSFGGGVVNFLTGNKGVASHFHGKDRVPRDNYAAVLHRGERVLTRQEADVMDAVKPNMGKIIEFPRVKLPNFDDKNDRFSGDAYSYENVVGGDTYNDNRSYHNVTNTQEGGKMGGGIHIAKIADQVVIREESDIQKVAEHLATIIEREEAQMG